MLWDIYDSNNDDYSNLTNLGDTSLNHSPDGIGDSLSNGIANIMNVLLNRNVNGHHPDNIDEFWEAWFMCDSSLGHGNAMEDIWYEHGEEMHCCEGLRDDVKRNCEISEPNVTDAVFLVNYIFKGGPSPSCEDEADVVIDNMINVADLTYLVNALFKGGPPVPACQ